jgi:hypothetical protein
MRELAPLSLLECTMMSWIVGALLIWKDAPASYSSVGKTMSSYS